MSRHESKKGDSAGDYHRLEDDGSALHDRIRPTAPPAPPSASAPTTPSVWPADVLHAGEARMSGPNYSGDAGLREMASTLHQAAAGNSKSSGTNVKWDVVVRKNQIGYYTTRDGDLRLLPPGRHWTKGALDSKCAAVNLDQDEIHLPPATRGNPSRFHIIRVNPGQVVSYHSQGVPGFLTAGRDAAGREVPGYHVIDDDRTFAVTERIDVSARRVVKHSGPNWIVKVPPGEVCKAYVGSNPVLLSEGMHVFNDATFRVKNDGAAGAFVKASDTHIKHGTLNIIRLSRGQLLAAKLGTEFHLLGAHQLLSDRQLRESNADLLDFADEENKLIYRFNSQYFQPLFHGDNLALHRVSDSIIRSGGPLFIANVREGSLLRIWDKGKPVFLDSSDKPYVINDPSVRLASEDDANPDYRYPARVSKGANVIRHGTECRIFVPDGQIFLAQIRGRAVMLGARKLMQGLGVDGIDGILEYIDPADLTRDGDHYTINDPSFRLLGETDPVAAGDLPRYVSKALSSEVDISHGNVTLLHVKPGDVAVVKNRRSGKFEILEAGKHIIVGPGQTLMGKMPCPDQQRVMDLEELDAQTSDFHELKVNASITYQISDPALAAQQAELIATLQKQCHSALGNCIRSTKLESMGSGNVLHHLDTKTASGEEKAEQQGPEDEFHRAFDSAKAQLSESLESIGIHLVSINIQQWSPVNPDVRRGLESANLTALEAMRNVATAEAEALKQKAEAEGNAAATVLAAQSEADARMAAVEADTAASIKAAEAEQRVKQIEADSVLALAQARAKATLVEAEAEAAAIEMRGKAEAEATSKKMEALGKTPAGEWARQLQMAMGNVFDGANVTVTPQDMGQLMMMMFAGGPMMSSARSAAMQQASGMMPTMGMFGSGAATRMAPASMPATVAAPTTHVDAGEDKADAVRRASATGGH